MPKVTVTFDFTSEAEAAAFLSGKEHKPHVEHKAPLTPVAAEPEAKPVEQSASAPQFDAPAAKTATTEDCGKAYTAYVGRKEGRTAKTGRDAIIKVIPHFNNFSALSAEERGVAVEVLNAS